MYVFDERWHTKIDEKGNHTRIHNKLTGKHKHIDSYTAPPHAKNVVTDEFTVKQVDTISLIGGYIYRHAKKRKIKTLYLCSHGNAGYMELGTGLEIASQAQFSKLHDHHVFAPGAVVELHGCCIASAVWATDAPPVGKDGKANGKETHPYWKEDGIGHKFMKALAKTLQVTVKAGIQEQHGYVDFHFDGTVITVTPDGKASVDNGPSH
jgi:hypothetical protein